ncbi:TPA: T9SS type A sorting domain-containing protein [bacterium]|nr:T9SS type A sorting domain-containing protein [bacterium]
MKINKYKNFKYESIIIQTFILSILLFALDCKAQCPTSKYGLIPVWPQNWTNTDKTNWYQMMYSKGNGFTQLNFTWAEAQNLMDHGQIRAYVDYVKSLKSTYNLKIHLSLKNPSTYVNYVPAAFTGLNFEDTTLTNAYFEFATNLIDSFATTVDYFSIGVESDIYFKDHPEEIDEFVTLFSNISDYVHLNYPSIKISTAVTYIYGIEINDTIWQSTKNFSDVLCITYWPLNNDFTVISTAISDISSDMNTLLQKAGSKPIVIKEVGFPSSSLTNSSEIMQRNFIEELFWQTMYKPQIEGVELQFLADFNSSSVNYWANFYQVNSPIFEGYVGSLGLMDTLGTHKLAYTTYLQMLDTLCTISNIADNPKSVKLIMYPNPVNSFVTVNTEKKCLIEIYTITGSRIISTYEKNINLAHFAPSVYLILVKDEFGKKLIMDKLVKY